MSKRKVSSDINSRNKKKVKQDAADPLLQSFEGFFLLPKDCRREIVRHINDIDMLKSLRTSRQWREEATAEINSRFACKYLTRLKAMSAPSPSLNEIEITTAINHIDAQVTQAKQEIDAMNKQLTELGKMRMSATSTKALSIQERFDLWSDPKVPKKTYRSVRECYMQPEGEEDVWDIISFDQPYGTVHDFDVVIDCIYQHLSDLTDDEVEVEARLDKYKQVMMDINFGQLVRD